MNRLMAMLVSLAALALCGCGSSNRLLTSIAVSPATAQPADPAAGVQFTATGTFDHPPATVTPLPVLWSLNVNSLVLIPAPPVTVDGNGLAHCNGYKGSLTITAFHSTDPKIIPGTPDTSTRHPVIGTATLTCK